MSARIRRFIATFTVACAALLALASTSAPEGLPRSEVVDRAVAAKQAPPVVVPAREKKPKRKAKATTRRGWLTARVTRPVLLRSKPGGPRIARLGTKTEFGSPRVLSVVRRRGDWLGVTVPQTGNDRLGWISANRVRVGRVRRSLIVELSSRRMILRLGRRTLRQVTIGIGGPESPTPLGRFAVTDRLRMASASPYGCCALALSGRQPRVPAWWTGGNRLAIHGTPEEWKVGRAASLGCLHARASDLEDLMRAVPLGAPVFIRA